MNKAKENKFLKHVTNLGLWISHVFSLQLLWLVYSLKGLMIGGVFPATASTVSILYRWFDEKEANFSIQEEFKNTYRTEFKIANAIGYISLMIAGILYVDLRVSNVFIQSIFLHTALLFFSAMVLSVGLYLFTVLRRYDFSVKDVFKQSFFVALSVPIYTIAAVIALILSVSLLINFSFLLVFFGVPIILAPVVWFTYNGVLIAEEKRVEEA